MSKDCGVPLSLALFQPRYWLSWIGLGVLAFIAQLPTSVRHWLGKRLGKFIYQRNQKRRHAVNTNLKIAFPELSDAERDVMTLTHLQWYGCAIVDYSLLFFASNQRLARMLKIEGKEYIDSALAENKNAMILLAHSVMLEFAPAALGLHYDVFGSYKASKNALLNWIIAKSRCRHVKFVVSREEGLRKLIKSLAPGKIMIFLPDEDLGSDNATFVPFFNKDKATLTTTARIAKMGKAVAFPAFAWFDEKEQKYILQIMPALSNYPSGDAKKDAITLNQALEAMIKQHPEQYMWLMKWYRTRPDGEAGLY